nr:immunoglobulin heavy chain junction region [Mus musculus]MBK4195283.1 immunoglobulin heavy chain junction region [Mus musculus]MBK4195284.1 immunoglobulin heavy chain junction region [Mus musculus]
CAREGDYYGSTAWFAYW